MSFHQVFLAPKLRCLGLGFFVLILVWISQVNHLSTVSGGGGSPNIYIWRLVESTAPANCTNQIQSAKIAHKHDPKV